MLYATTSPFYWHGVSGGGEGPWTKGRAWAAELELLPGHPPVKRENPLRPQTILDPEFVRVKRVIPVEHAIAEETGYLGGDYVGSDYTYRKTAAPFVDEGMVGEDWGSSASGLLVTDGDRVLLLKRSPYVQDPGLWGIPGGAVPVDYDTGKRKDAKRSALDEAREEMGGIPSGSVGGKHVFRKPSGFTFTTFVWETDPDSLDRFTPRLNWEHTDWGLFDLDDIKPSGIHPGVIWVLKRMGR
jgi:ADP-ribose pyrophosphatase YjhB (NUDIX family)